MCEECRTPHEKRMHAMAESIEKQYKQLLDMQRHLIPRYLRNMQLIAHNSTGFELKYQSQELARITCILVNPTSNGTLNLGNMFNFPITPGQYPLQLAPDGLIIEPGFQITVSQTNPGDLAIWCMGQLMADRGNRW